VPLIEGGGRMIVRDFAAALRERGHEVDTVEIPFHSMWDEMLEQMLALRLLDVTASADVLVAIRTPSHLLRHPNKRIWFIHHHRGAYDLWDTPFQDIPGTPEGLRVRDAIMRTDDLYLREAQRIFAISEAVSSRLQQFNALDSTVLYPPLGSPETFYNRPAGDYVFYPSRILGHKRQLLAVQAAAHLQSDARVVIAGVPDERNQLATLEREIARHGLEERVELIPRWISEEEKAERMAGSMGALFVPYLEDYGYVTLEAFHSAKPVITCRDSGGPVELVADGANGFVVDPDPVAIAAAIDRLRTEPELAAALGQRALETVERMDITWDRVVAELLA
jgi:glycosyltransferase involved in cell wall biosynthesis